MSMLRQYGEMEKQRWEESGGEEQKRENQRRERVRTGAQKGRKANDFPMICGSGGSKSRLAKAPGAEPSAEMRSEKLHATGAK